MRPSKTSEIQSYEWRLGTHNQMFLERVLLWCTKVKICRQGGGGI